jgi:hypothetical protein
MVDNPLAIIDVFWLVSKSCLHADASLPAVKPHQGRISWYCNSVLRMPLPNLPSGGSVRQDSLSARHEPVE